MDFIEQLAGCIPCSAETEIPWRRFDQLFAAAGLSELKKVPQNPAFHGEGEAYTHTRMVCKRLLAIPAFQALPDLQKRELFLAAVLHDIGKGHTTRMEDGNWVSPRHASTGSQIARTFLWLNCGLCGTKDMMIFRETVCALIRYHMLPVHLMERDGAERRVRELAVIGELAEDFSWHLLCALAEADVKGRIAADIESGLARVELSRMMAEQTGCLYAPYQFSDSFTKRAYLSGRGVQPDQALYDNTWGEVVMLSGLPGTGKDTWIQSQHPDMPVVSLDEIRSELGAKPVGPQGEVIQAAQTRAKGYLRRKQPFIWNATNLTKDIRQGLIRLFESYGARVRIVYLETGLKTRMARNLQRAASVPENAVSRMLGKTVPPTPDEAQTVEWLCV